MSSVRMPTPYFQPVSDFRSHSNMVPVSGLYPMFSARQKTQPVDWRKIAALNVDQMAQAFDVNILQENIHSIAFCDIESEVDMRLVDPNYVKLFKLSQLTIEYLLNSQDYLTHQLTILEENMKQYKQKVEDTQAQCDKLQKDLAKVAKESHKRKKLLIAQQQLIPRTFGNYHKCRYCPKSFLNEPYLQKHVSRRHADVAEPISTQVADVDTSSGHGSGSRSSLPATAAKNVISDLEIKLKAMKDDLSIVKERELQKQAEIENLKKLFEERNNQYEADLVDLRRKLIQQSNLGSICDDDDDDEVDNHRITAKSLKDVNTHSAVELVKNAESPKQEHKTKKSKVSEPLLEKKVQLLEKNFNTQIKKQEKEYQVHMKNMKEKYEQDILLMQQKLKESAVIASNMAVKRKLNYSKEPVQINKPKVPSVQKENKIIENSFISHVMPIEKSESSDEEEDEEDEEEEDEEDDDDDDKLSDETEEEEDEDDRKENEVKEFTLADQTFGNTMSNGTGSLTERMKPVRAQITENSNIRHERRLEMANLLSEKLKNIGLPQSTNGISKKILSDKLSIMKKERLAKSKRYPNFEKKWQHLNKLAENKARKNMEAKYSAKDIPQTSVKLEKPHANQATRKVPKKPSAKVITKKPPSPVSSKKQSNVQTPNPTLRENIIPPKSQISLGASSSKQWPQELWKRESDDDDKLKSDSWSDSEDDVSEFLDMSRHSTSKRSPPVRPPAPLKQSLLNKSVTSAQQLPMKPTSLPEQMSKKHPPVPSSSVMKTPPVPFPRTKPSAELFDSDDVDSDSLPDFNGIQTAPAGQTSSTAYSNYKQPKREPNIARLGHIIEDKMTNRPSVQFAGGVDLLNLNNTPKTDDSDYSKVSSLEDDQFDDKFQNPRFSSTPAVKGHHIETDASSNTYSTSFWGSSKGVSSISANGSMASNKQLTPSENDWDL